MFIYSQDIVTQWMRWNYKIQNEKENKSNYESSQ